MNKTTVPEEAVKAALETWQDHEFDGTLDYPRMRNALTAALPFLPVQGAVKKLEWNEYEDEQGIPDRWDAEASSFGVFYSIEIQHDGYRVVFDHEAVGAVGVFDTLEAAKAAAQASYEARILSALEPSAARELALEEGFRKGKEAAAKLIECGCKDLLHGKGECQFPGNCSLEDSAAIRALNSNGGEDE